VGGERTIKTDARVIAATNLDIERLVRDGHFREDLYYRLHDVEIRVPPLRERKEDILPMAARFTHEFDRKYRKQLTGLTAMAEDLLLEHDWPGNVRELRSLIRRGAAIAGGRKITVRDLDLKVKKIDSQEKSSVDDLSLSNVEKKHILKIIALTGGNKSRAAEILGISRSTLERRLRRWSS